jgi:hypothetical protein
MAKVGAASANIAATASAPNVTRNTALNIALNLALNLALNMMTPSLSVGDDSRRDDSRLG